tara:strand:- start:2148 stop:2474 length:327 start_codon:yes stop_codon:yes gene_type:complete
MLILKDMKELKSFILKNNKVCLLFSASWCGPCKVFKKKLEDEDNEYKDVKIGYCDIDNDEFQDICDTFLIESIPTCIFVEVENSTVKEIGRVTGYDWSKFIMVTNSLF